MDAEGDRHADSHTIEEILRSILISLTALTILVQVTGAGQPEKPSVAAVSPDPGASAQARHRLQPGARGTGRLAVSPPGNKKLGAGRISPSTALFLPAVTYGSGGGSPDSVAVADMNRDGIPDLVVANGGSNTVGILPGNGDGTFRTAATYDSGGQFPVSVAVADLHYSPGQLEVVVANGCADKSACSGSGESGVGVLFGFGPTATYRSGGSEVQSVKIADVNSDGIPDLLVAHICARRNRANCTTNTPGSVGVLLGHDDIFSLVNTYNSGGFQTSSLEVADVNGDGQPDLVVVNPCAISTNCINGSVGVLLGNGDGTFKKAVTYQTGFSPFPWR